LSTTTMQRSWTSSAHCRRGMNKVSSRRASSASSPATTHAHFTHSDSGSRLNRLAIRPKRRLIPWAVYVDGPRCGW
jgi:hypothetical protein